MPPCRTPPIHGMTYIQSLAKDDRNLSHDRLTNIMIRSAKEEKGKESNEVGGPQTVLFQFINTMRLAFAFMPLLPTSFLFASCFTCM